jgi:hypothetical protein
VAFTKRSILTAALREIGALGPTDTIGDDEADVAGDVFDRVFDDWNAERRAVYASTLQTFTLTPNLSPHTIGPSGTFNVTQRPIEIESAGLVLTSGSLPIRRPIHIRDKAWYAGVRAKSLASAIPENLYYEPDWPLGKVFFVTVPSTAYSVELLLRMLLTALALDDAFTMPPGYRSAVTLTVAEACADGPFARTLSRDFRDRAGKARMRVFGNNVSPPRIATRDAGMPGKRVHGKLNWLSREIV